MARRARHEPAAWRRDAACRNAAACAKGRGAGERIDADRAKTRAVEVHELGERAVRAAHGVARRAQARLTGFPDLGEPFLAKEALQAISPQRWPARC